MDCLSFAAPDAISLFSQCRHPGIQRENYTHDLLSRGAGAMYALDPLLRSRCTVNLLLRPLLRSSGVVSA